MFGSKGNENYEKHSRFIICIFYKVSENKDLVTCTCFVYVVLTLNLT